MIWVHASECSPLFVWRGKKITSFALPKEQKRWVDATYIGKEYKWRKSREVFLKRTEIVSKKRKRRRNKNSFNEETVGCWKRSRADPLSVMFVVFVMVRFCQDLLVFLPLIRRRSQGCFSEIRCQRVSVCYVSAFTAGSLVRPQCRCNHL